MACSLRRSGSRTPGICTFIAFAAGMLSLASEPAAAQQRSATESSPAAATAQARLRLQSTPATGVMRIDGQLDEAAWGTADVATGFTQRAPQAGSNASERTEVRVLHGPDALYIGARMYDSAPDSIMAPLMRRDATRAASDWFDVIIDSYNDRRTAFRFAVNPRGVKRDIFHYNDAEQDGSWDAVWEVATQVDSLGWTAEFRIPYAQLRFGSVDAERTWGINFSRNIARREELSYWSPVLPNHTGLVSRAGELLGLADIVPPRRLELQPYVSAMATRAPGSREDPFFRATAPDASVGVDLRYGISSALTLTATINPDFGQVEVDPAVVNLTAFETFFPENRAFFSEGSDIFRFGALQSFINVGVPQFFYSRRIGRTPQRRIDFDPDMRYVDAPTQSTILGAAKLSGRTTSGWSLGLLNALTGEERARFVTVDDEWGSTAVEPLTNYLVARARRDLNMGRTAIGGILTTTHRELGEPAFHPMLRHGAAVAGVDGEHSFANRVWTISGYAAGSRVQGSQAAIALSQRSSVRYLQRPDAGHLHYDPDRTSLDGHAAGFAVRRMGNWRGSMMYQQISPGFEANESGFQSRADAHALGTLFGHEHSRPGRIFRTRYIRGFTSHQWNFGGDLLDANYNIRANGTFRNLWSAGTTVSYGAPVLNDRVLRGGPLMRRPPFMEVASNVATDPRRTVSGGVDAAHAWDEHGNAYAGVGVSATARPATNVQLSISPSLSRQQNNAQYVLQRVDEHAEVTFGRRYVLAALDQITMAIGTRVDWTFTPTLSLQLYARPFVSAGQYRDFKELQQPGGYDFARYGEDVGSIELGGTCNDVSAPDRYAVNPDGAGPAGCFTFANPDFNVRSLRGNAVLRWEYRPGSTLFVVWQQERSGVDPTGTFALGRDLGGVFNAPAQNVLLVKATYWMGR